MDKPKKVLVAKVGLDGHDVGAKVVCQALRTAGMEVIYTGLRQTPEKVVAAALDEDVDVIGVSSLSGAHMHHVPRIIQLLKERRADDIVVVVGGTIPPDDARELQRIGVARVFRTDSDTSHAVEFLRQLPERRL